MFTSDQNQFLKDNLKSNYLIKYYSDPHTSPQDLLNVIQNILTHISDSEFYHYSNEFANTLKSENKKDFLKNLQRYYYDLIIIAYCQYNRLENLRNNPEQSSLSEDGIQF